MTDYIESGGEPPEEKAARAGAADVVDTIPPRGESPIPDHSTTFRVVCARERRLIERLLESSCARRELDGAVGTTNSSEYVRRCRLRGINIIMTPEVGRNRYGEWSWRGIYSLDPDDRQKAREALGAFK